MKPPSPVEWMAFADGELDPERAEEIIIWLEAHPADARRLQGLEAFNESVHEAASARYAPPADFDLSGDIMAAIEREAPRESAPTKSGPRLILKPRPASGAPQAPPSAAPAPSRPRTWAPVAFGLIAAAAAGLLWLKTEATQAPTAARPAQTASAMIASVSLDEDAVISDDGSAINAVDFGTQSGAIFYVRGQNTTSAVLWIDDNDSP